MFRDRWILRRFRGLIYEYYDEKNKFWSYIHVNFQAYHGSVATDYVHYHAFGHGPRSSFFPWT